MLVEEKNSKEKKLKEKKSRQKRKERKIQSALRVQGDVWDPLLINRSSPSQGVTATKVHTTLAGPAPSEASKFPSRY